MDRAPDRHAALAGTAAGRGRRPGLVLVLVAGAFAVMAAVRTFVAEPIAVSTSSMTPTLRPGESVLVNKLAYRLKSPRRRDLVVFRRPGSGELLLKRIVGLGGDRLGVRDGVLYVNGRPIREPFVDRRLVDSVYFGPVRVPPGAVFLMGDQRSDSLDSRDFGAVPRRRILGRVDLRLWPPGTVGD